MILFLYNQYVVNALLHNSFSNRIYPGKTQILLTINVDTRLQSCELSAPVLLSTILYITQLSNHNMGMTELYISTYIELVNRMIYIFTIEHILPMDNIHRNLHEPLYLLQIYNLRICTERRARIQNFFGRCSLFFFLRQLHYQDVRELKFSLVNISLSYIIYCTICTFFVFNYKLHL